MFCAKCGSTMNGGAACPQCGAVAETTGAAPPTVIVNSTTKVTNPLGTAGFVLSLISVLFSWVPGVGWLVWFLGALFSCIGVFKQPKGLAIAGLVLSFIDLIILLVVIGAVASLA